MSLTDNRIVTMGKLFANGAAIDQLRGGQLILWQEGDARIGPSVEYDIQTFAPASLDGGLEYVLQLPVGPGDFGGADELIEQLREPLTIRGGLDGDAAFLLAIAILATWVADCLPGPLVINPCGPVGTETPLLELVGALCRRSLRLAEPSLHGLASLPAGLEPTLILPHPSERTLTRLVAAAAERDTFYVTGGEITQVRCAIVACTCKPVPMPALTIPLLPIMRTLGRITKPELQGLAEHFQPRLLQYRLSRHLAVSNSQFDVLGFCPAVRLLARVLGAVIEGSEGLQASLVSALSSLDEQHKSEQSQTFAAVLDSLLTLSHSRRPLAYIGEIAELANSILEMRGENVVLSPRAVGEILRQDLGLSGRRRTLGYELALDHNAQQRVHRLASAYNVLQPVADCRRCQEVLVSITPNDHPVSGA